MAHRLQLVASRIDQHRVRIAVDRSPPRRHAVDERALLTVGGAHVEPTARGRGRQQRCRAGGNRRVGVPQVRLVEGQGLGRPELRHSLIRVAIGASNMVARHGHQYGRSALARPAGLQRHALPPRAAMTPMPDLGVMTADLYTAKTPSCTVGVFTAEPTPGMAAGPGFEVGTTPGTAQTSASISATQAFFTCRQSSSLKRQRQ